VNAVSFCFGLDQVFEHGCLQEALLIFIPGPPEIDSSTSIVPERKSNSLICWPKPQAYWHPEKAAVAAVLEPPALMARRPPEIEVLVPTVFFT
jgi:hypothetical protein